MPLIQAQPAVSVIIPAFNAARTIGRTLASVRAQTYANLEIIVVDDGSHDGTLAHAHAQAQAAGDPRIRVIRQANAGVAAARNRAIAAATAEYVAPIDADDLWRPEKIAKQMAVMAARGPGTGLVYTWSALIDQDDRVAGLSPPVHHEGRVFERLCVDNFIGNGSSVLMRKSAVTECGGYDPRLAVCEDHKLFLAIAERHDFAVVPDHLTGYRLNPGSLSADVRRMMRGFDLAMSPVARRYPALRAGIRQARIGTALWYVERARRHRGRAAAWTAAAGIGVRALGGLAGHPRLFRQLLRLLIGTRRIPPLSGEDREPFLLADLAATPPGT